ncbi:HAD family hydrolase [Pediococcus ethanolidurans]|uniref:HAD family hydrolase n=1 Tax=Pediococcus ethanolidurans TaxID=319653 RepID=UPI002953EE52|nr:HAD family phosphatase [Pediococcus ethanolidurans]
MLSNKNVIFFDMDGLLLDTEKLYFETRRDILTKYGYTFRKEDHTEYIAKGFPVTIKKLTQLVGNANLGKQVFNEAMELYRQRLENGDVQVKTGAVELLTFLHQTHRKCYVTSSAAKETIIQTAEITGIAQYFTDFISGDEVKHNKPAPDLYLYALEKSHATKSETVIFEDATTGILSAASAGLDVVLVPDWIDPEPEIRQKAVAVLPNLLEAISLFK